MFFWKNLVCTKPGDYNLSAMIIFKKNPEKLNNKAAIYILSIMFLCMIVKKQSRFALKCKP